MNGWASRVNDEGEYHRNQNITDQVESPLMDGVLKTGKLDLVSCILFAGSQRENDNHISTAAKVGYSV